MAPAAANAQETMWSDEVENSLDFELGSGGATSSSGNGSSAAALESEDDRGWQKVINPKKQRRKEKEAKAKSGAPVENVVGSDPEATAFRALEKETEERRARRKARQDAWASANGNHAASDVHHSDEEEEVEDRNHSSQAQVGNEEKVKKKKQKRVKKAKVSFAEAAKAIDAADLQSHLRDLSEISPEAQLFRCTDYFEEAFSGVSPSLFSWESIAKEPLQKSLEVPLKDVPGPVCEVMLNWFQKHPAESLSGYAIWALDELLDIPVQSKGMSAAPNKTKAAVATVLACLLRRKPEALVASAAKLRGPQYQGPLKLQTLAWAYGQAVLGNVVSGMVLWVQNLLPLAVGSSSTPMSRGIALRIVESIEYDKRTRSELINNANRKGERLLPPSALISLLHMAYPSDSARTKATERFLRVYPILKEIALAGTLKSKPLRNVAQQLFPMALAAAAEDNRDLSEEASSICWWCLCQSPECLKLWEKLHVEKLKGSICLLEYLVRNWSESLKLLPMVEFKQTLSVLRKQHGEAVKKRGKDEQLALDVKKADSLCVKVQKRTGAGSSCLKATVVIGVIVAMVGGFYAFSPANNPWGWDGKLLLSETHRFFHI